MKMLRGAITVDKNSKKEIEKSTLELFDEILKRNKLNNSNFKTIIFSVTDDVDKAYPAKFLREKRNLTDCKFMHFNEMKVENSLKKCIRLLAFIELDSEKEDFILEDVYLKEAKNLRKDKIKK